MTKSLLQPLIVMVRMLLGKTYLLLLMLMGSEPAYSIFLRYVNIIIIFQSLPLFELKLFENIIRIHLFLNKVYWTLRR